MSTTTVKKGTNRPAAVARANRHAQRTPLPPRPGTVEDAKEVLATVPAKSTRSAKTAAKAASVAVDQPSPQTQGKTTKKASAADTAKSGPKAPQLPDSTKSERKARAFILAIESYGWTVETSSTGEQTSVTAKRGSEVLHQVWHDGVWNYSESTYTMADRNLKPRNVSDAVKRYAARPPEAAETEHEKVGNNRAWRRKPTEPKRSRLPFDVALATDEEVITALLGRAVAWHNQYRETAETAIVGLDAKKVHFTEYKGQRIFNFCCPVGGYRSFRLSDLIKVGKGHGPTKGQQTAEVTVEEE